MGFNKNNKFNKLDIDYKTLSNEFSTKYIDTIFKNNKITFKRVVYKDLGENFNIKSLFKFKCNKNNNIYDLESCVKECCTDNQCKLSDYKIHKVLDYPSFLEQNCNIEFIELIPKNEYISTELNDKIIKHISEIDEEENYIDKLELMNQKFEIEDGIKIKNSNAILKNSLNTAKIDCIKNTLCIGINIDKTNNKFYNIQKK